LEVEFKEQVALLVFQHKELKKMKGRKCSGNMSYRNSRQERGVFYTALNYLRNDKEIFIYFRMSVGSFDELHQHIWNDISGSDANMRRKFDLCLSVRLQCRQYNKIKTN
jgi:hypothetical protein